MSLINQVLKDLDRQRGPADGLQVSALQGIGLVHSEKVRWPAMLTISTLCLALVAGFVLFESNGSWTDIEPEIKDQPAVETLLTSASAPQPKTLETTPDTVATPAPPLPVEPSPSELVTRVSVAPVADESTAIAPSAKVRPRQPVKTLSARQHAEHAFAAAQKAIGRNDKIHAEQLLNSALEYHPQHADARIRLTAIYLERGDSAAAERVLENGLALDPTQSELARLYAQLLAARGEFDTALQALLVVTDSQSADAESLALRAAVYARLNNYADAASSYRQALKLDAGQANWWMGLGLALEHQELYSSAADAYQNANSLPLADNVKAFVRQRLEQLQNTAGDG